MNFLPLSVIRKYSPPLASALVAAAGFLSLAQVLTIRFRRHAYGRIDDSLLPFTAAQNSHLFILVIGLLLLYLSLQIYRRKMLAYQLVSVGLAMLIGIEIFTRRNDVQLLFYVFTLGLLLLTRAQYTVTTNNLSLRRGAAMGLVIITVVFVYATIGFSELGGKAGGPDISLAVSAKYAAREIFTFQESQLPLSSRYARWFVASVDAAAIVAYSLAVISLFRPLQFQYGASRHDRQLARQILAEHSADTEDFFKLWPLDKHYFFSPDRDSFVAYKVMGSQAFVLGGPAGNSASFSGLLSDFVAFCRRSGWSAALINASASVDAYLPPKTFQRLFIGNEAVIDVAEFAASTFRSKHFRYIKNRAARDGLSFAYWTAPLRPGQIAELRKVSKQWLGARSRREYTFAMGYFDTEYIRSCDVAVIIRDGHVAAYANVLPQLLAGARTIDHMRYTPGLPAAGMHYLLMQLILIMHTSGISTFNLGLAPLSGIEERTAVNLPERLLGALKKIGGRYYSFEGLEQFKNKFEPRWEARYIYYQGSPASLPGLARNLGKALAIPVAGRSRRIVVRSLSLLAALFYASFPLAFWLKPQGVFAGAVSDLGASGRAFAALFNGLDIVSSLLIFTCIFLLWTTVHSERRLPRVVLGLLGLSALGTLLAAITPLPAADYTAIQNGLHDFFSGVNLVGICGAALGLVLYTKRPRWLTALLASLVASLVLSAWFEGTLAGDIAQRLLIILTAVWIVIICVRLARPAATPHAGK